MCLTEVRYKLITSCNPTTCDQVNRNQYLQLAAMTHDNCECVGTGYNFNAGDTNKIFVPNIDRRQSNNSIFYNCNCIRIKN